jgi:hypothetical protein
MPKLSAFIHVMPTQFNHHRTAELHPSGFGVSPVGSSRALLHHAQDLPSPEPRWSTGQPFLVSGIFPIGISAVVLPHISCNTKPRVIATCLPLSLGDLPCHVLFGISPIANPKGKFLWWRKPRNAELRYAGSDATCPSVDRRFPLLWEIATRDFEGYEPLFCETPNAEPRFKGILRHMSRRSINGPD